MRGRSTTWPCRPCWTRTTSNNTLFNGQRGTLLLTDDGLGKHAEKKTAKRLPDQVPLGLYTHMGGLIITIAGMPVDLGLPAGIDLKTARKLGLLDT